MGDGASYLVLPVAQALPRPPDVAVLGAVPGGVLLPCSPIDGVVTVNRNQYALRWEVGQGTLLTIRRIHVELPVWLGEEGLEKQETATDEKTEFGTEAEAKEFDEGKSATGQPQHREAIQPISYSAPYEKKVSSFTHGINPLNKKQAGSGETTVTERSILPITVLVVARLIGPEGPIWSESYEAPMHYVSGVAGAAQGTGFIDAYSDLQNGLTIDPDKAYGLQLELLIPTAASSVTNTQLGLEIVGGTAVPGKGGVTLFYDIATGSPGK